MVTLVMISNSGTIIRNVTFISVKFYSNCFYISILAPTNRRVDLCMQQCSPKGTKMKPKYSNVNQVRFVSLCMDIYRVILHVILDMLENGMSRNGMQIGNNLLSSSVGEGNKVDISFSHCSLQVYIDTKF